MKSKIDLEQPQEAPQGTETRLVIAGGNKIQNNKTEISKISEKSGNLSITIAIELFSHEHKFR